jgi:LAO/AO transport system kinase
LVVSALEGVGVAQLWETLSAHRAQAEAAGAFRERRARQRKAWFESALQEALQEAFARRPGAARALRAAEASVEAGTLSPVEAAQRLVTAVLAP